MQVVVAGPVPPLRGGIAQHTAYTAQALRDEGHAVEVVSWRALYPRLLYSRPQHDDAAVDQLDARWLLRWWNPLSWIGVARRARRADVLFLPWVTPVHGVPQWVMARFSGPATVVVHVHNVEPHERLPFAEVLGRLVLRRADRLLCHARSLEADLRRLGIETPTRVLPMPAHADVTEHPLPPRPPVRLLVFGFVRPYKGVEVALDALRVLCDRGHDARMTIAGEVWGDDEIWHEHIRSRGLSEVVDARFDYVPDDEIDDLYAAHHLVVAAHTSATQSGVLSIAAAAGRPVVASRAGGLPDRIEEGRNGMLAEPGDARSLADALERAISDLDRLAAGAGASDFPWSAYAAAVVEPT